MGELTLPNFRTSYIATVIKTVELVKRDTDINGQNRELTNSATQVWSPDLRQSCKTIH